MSVYGVVSKLPLPSKMTELLIPLAPLPKKKFLRYSCQFREWYMNSTRDRTRLHLTAKESFMVREMAAFQTHSLQLNSNPIVNTSPVKNSSPSAMPPIPNFSSPEQNSSNVGTKRKETGTPPNDIPSKKSPPAWLSGRELFCEICNVELNSVSQAIQHRQGKIHLNKVKKVEKFRTVS